MTEILWTDKYKPDKFDNLILDPLIRKEFDIIFTKKDIPNLIFFGDSGVGKTSSMNIIVNGLYGKYVNDYVLKINVVKNKGIKIKEIIETFLKKIMIYNDSDINKYAKHKLIIIDEFDNIMPKIQSGISKIINNNKDKIKILITCNNIKNVIPSLQSICKIIKFEKINKQQICEYLIKICKNENINFDIDAIEYISHYSNGDMRICVNMLYVIYIAYKHITLENIYEIFDDKPQIEKIKCLIQNCIDKNIEKYIENLIDLENHGYTYKDIAFFLFDILKSPTIIDIKNDVRLLLLQKLSSIIVNILNNYNHQLQLITLIDY